LAVCGESEKRGIWKPMVKLTADDFFTGLFAALVRTGLPGLSIRGSRFDESIAGVFDKLRESAPEKDLDIRFRIRLHKFHNDSIATRNAVYSAAQNGLVSLENPEYQDMRFKINEREADELLKKVPGGKELYSDLAKEFLSRYDPVKV